MDRSSFPTLTLLFGVLFSQGCVSIRHLDDPCIAGQTRSIPVCDNPYDEDDCQLPHRGYALVRVSQKLRSLHPLDRTKMVMGHVAERAKSTYFVVRGKHHEWKEGCRTWVARKRLEANPPPWPKFHPIPASPAFETALETRIEVPETFGAFAPE